MVLKSPLIGDTSEASSHSFFRSQGKQSFKPFFWETELWVSMIVLVRNWSWKGHQSVTLAKPLLICSGLRETDLWAVLLGDRALSPHDCFNGKIILKMLLLGDSGEALTLHIHCSGVQVDRASSQHNSFIGRWSWKGCALVTLGKPLHIHWLGLLGDRTHEVDMIPLLGSFSFWDREACAYSFRCPRR